MTNPVVTFRRAKRGDAEAVLAIEELSLPDPWNDRLLAAYLTDDLASVWLAETGGTAIGHSIFQSTGEEIELLRLGVDPAWQRSGVGGELVARGLAEALAGGVRACFLEVRVDNLPARRLYERLGFRVVGVRTRYYPDGVDAAVYRRDLGNPVEC